MTKKSTMDLVQRCQIVEKSRLELEASVRTAISRGLDRNGNASSRLCGNLKSLACCAWYLRQDAHRYQRCLSEIGPLMISICDRDAAGTITAGSTLSSHAYSELMDLLAGGHLSAAVEFAHKLGHRPELDREVSHPFAIAFGQGLRHTVLQQPTEARRFLDDAMGMIGQKECLKTHGYVSILRACLDGDLAAANRALKDIAAGHPRELKRGGMFEDDLIHLCLCHWGVAVANLARGIYDLPVDAIPPLIPTELLVPTKSAM